MSALVWKRGPHFSYAAGEPDAVEGQYSIWRDPGNRFRVMHRTTEALSLCHIGETGTLENARALAQAHADRDRTEISTDAQAPTLAAKPRRYIPPLILLHSQALDVWAVTLADTNLGDDDDDDRLPVYFFSTKELAERYINMMSLTDDDYDDNDEPAVRADANAA